MLYRLLAARRFRRVCFVVDRSFLGKQAGGEFSTTRVVGANTFADTFGLKGLDETTPDEATKVHICTIQSLVKRVLFPATPEAVPPVDQYDLLVVDECHRGYTLDRELGEAELGFRDEGLRERFLHIDGDWRDHRTFALTREDVPGGLLARWNR